MPQNLELSKHQLSKDVILVVDDDEAILKTVVRLLERVGHTAVACLTPSAAVEELHQNRVCAVVSDISMPEMSGFALTRLVHERQPHVPVVLMTGGQPDPELGPIAADFGAFALLNKPVEAWQLWATIDRALEQGLRAL